MKKFFKMTDDNTIYITMYLRPEIYTTSKFVSSSSHVDKAEEVRKSRNSSSRRINGPLSDYGQELEPPIKEEYENFVLDCEDAVKDTGFVIISEHVSTDSKKSRYILLYGMKDRPCGYLVYELRISDHPLDVTFPKELKEKALEYLKVNHVLDETATLAGINFRIEKITVGSVEDDSWGRALDRLYKKLRNMKKKVLNTLKSRKN